VDRYHVVIKVQIYDIFIDYTECFVDLGYVSTFFSIKYILFAQNMSKWDRAQVMTTIIQSPILQLTTNYIHDSNHTRKCNSRFKLELWTKTSTNM